jgi:pyrroloquinoline quinone biosynthesis protein B
MKTGCCSTHRPTSSTQFQQFPELQPARALRDTAVRAIVLIDGQIDHTTGLYMLREHRQPHEIWCTRRYART